MGKASKQPDKITRRSLDKIEFNKVANLHYSNFSVPYCVDKPYSHEYYHLIVKSSGFLYNQVFIFLIFVALNILLFTINILNVGCSFI